MAHSSSNMGEGGRGKRGGERALAACVPAGSAAMNPLGKGAAAGAAAVKAAAATTDGTAGGKLAAEASGGKGGAGVSNLNDREEAAEPALLKRQQLLQRLELQQRASNLVAAVPTNDKIVRRILRLAEQPITYFGEGPFERRERLRLLFAEGRISVSAEQLQRIAVEEEEGAAATAAALAASAAAAAAAAVGKAAGAVAAGAGEVVGAAGEGEEEDQETFFTEGVPELKEARRLIFEDSVRRARARVRREKLLRRDVPRANSAAVQLAPLQQQQGQHAALSAATAAVMDGVPDGSKGGPSSKNSANKGGTGKSSNSSVDPASAAGRKGGGEAAAGAGGAAHAAADARRVGTVLLPRDSVLLRVLELERTLQQQLAATSSQIGSDRPLTACKFSPGVAGAAALWGAAGGGGTSSATGGRKAKRARGAHHCRDGEEKEEERDAGDNCSSNSDNNSCGERLLAPKQVQQQPREKEESEAKDEEEEAAAAKRFWEEAASTEYFSQYLATGSWNDTVRLWSVADGALLHELHGHSSRVHALAWRTAPPHKHLEAPADSADAEKGGIPLLLASGGGDARICVWDIHRLSSDSSSNSNSDLNSSAVGSGSSNPSSSGKRGTKSSKALVYTLKGHEDRVNRLLFHPSGRFLFSTSHDETWRMWDVETQQELLLQEGHAAPVYGLAAHADGSLLVTSDISGAVWVWDLRSGRAVLPLAAHVKQVVGVSLHPVIGNWLATAADDHAVKIWDLRKAARTALFSSPAPPTAARSYKKPADASVEFSAAATHAPVASSSSGAVGGLAAPSGSSAAADAEASGSTSSSSSAAAPAASTAASPPPVGAAGAGASAAAPSGEDVAAGETARPTATGAVPAASQQQQHAAAGAQQQQLRNSGKFLLTTVLAHHKLVADVMFEPVLGRCMYTAGFDGLVKVWNIHDFSCVKTLAGHEGRVMALDVMRGGKAVASAGFDRTWKLWSCSAAAAAGPSTK